MATQKIICKCGEVYTTELPFLPDNQVRYIGSCYKCRKLIIDEWIIGRKEKKKK